MKRRLLFGLLCVVCFAAGFVLPSCLDEPAEPPVGASTQSEHATP